MRLRATALFALALCAGTAWAAPADVVAVVNGQAVTRQEFGLSLVRSLGHSAIGSVVDRMLIEQEARRRGATVTEAELSARRALEVELRMRALLAGARRGPEDLRAAAEDLGWDAAQMREELAQSISPGALRARLLAEKLLAPELDLGDEALRAHFDGTRGPRYAAAHILVGTRADAERLAGLLREDMALWAELVLRFSLDRASVPYAGRLRPVAAGSELGRALAGTAPGELKVHGAGEAWHVLRLIEELPPSGEAFEQAQDGLRAELTALGAERRFWPFLAELNGRADVVVNLSADPRVRSLLGEDAAAFVNGERLALADLADLLVAEFGQGLLVPYVERLLLSQEAARRGVSVTDEELEERMEAVARRLFGEGARAQAPRLHAATEDLRATLLAEKMVAGDVQVTDADLRQAYEELDKDRFVVMELSTDDLAAARRMHRRVLEGADFDVVALAEAAGPGAWLAGGLVKTVAAGDPSYGYARRLREGEVSSVFERAGRYRIMRVLRRLPASDLPPFETVRESLAQEVRLRKSRARIRALLVKLEAEADLEVMLN